MEFWHSLRREENCIRDIPIVAFRAANGKKNFNLALDERKKLN
jgi:hypothetical protein